MFLLSSPPKYLVSSYYLYLAFDVDCKERTVLFRDTCAPDNRGFKLNKVPAEVAPERHFLAVGALDDNTQTFRCVNKNKLLNTQFMYSPSLAAFTASPCLLNSCRDSALFVLCSFPVCTDHNQLSCLSRFLSFPLCEMGPKCCMSCSV